MAQSVAPAICLSSGSAQETASCFQITSIAGRELEAAIEVGSGRGVVGASCRKTVRLAEQMLGKPEIAAGGPVIEIDLLRRADGGRDCSSVR